MPEPEFQRLLDRAGLAGRNYTRAQFEGKLQTNYKFMGLGTFILFVVSVRAAATWLRGCPRECVQGPGRVAATSLAHMPCLQAPSNVACHG